MNKIDLLYGFLIGIAASVLGIYIFITAFTDFDFAEGITQMRQKDLMGKIITLGAILNIAAFFALLRLKRDMMARGVVLATIVLAIFTLVV